MKLIQRTWENDQEYMEIISDLIDDQKLQKLDQITHHYYTTRLLHSLSVSYISYKLAKNLKLDYISTARAGLLHDFFLENRKEIQKLGLGSHNAAHPKIALKNAKKLTKINKIEKDIILKHMFLTTTKGGVPKYKESLIVSFVDKYCAAFEVTQPTRTWFKNIYAQLQTIISYT